MFEPSIVSNPRMNILTDTVKTMEKQQQQKAKTKALANSNPADNIHHQYKSHTHF